jgi:hypothetical protein
MALSYPGDATETGGVGQVRTSGGRCAIKNGLEDASGIKERILQVISGLISLWP